MSTARLSPEQAASQWVVRTGGRPPAPDESPDFTAWYAQADNARLFDEMAALWGQLDQVDGPALRAHSKKRKTRRRAGGALAGVLLAATLAWSQLPGHRIEHFADLWRANFSTSAEVSTHTLPDGSRVTLDAGTALALDFSPTRRDLRLLHGHARFEVAPDRERPFAVHAGDTVATALGTVFEVDATQPGQVQVTVLESRVDVRCTTCGATGGTTQQVLEAGQQATSDSAGVAPNKAPASDEVNGWLHARMSFTDTRVDQAAAQLQRWGGPRVIWLGDRAQQHVSAVVNAQQPEAALALLLQAAGLQSTRLPGVWLVSANSDAGQAEK